MIEQLKTYENNIIAIEVIDGFTEIDEQYCQKLFEAKRTKGFEQINVLVKLDDMKISKTSIKAFFMGIKKLYPFRTFGNSSTFKDYKSICAL